MEKEQIWSTVEKLLIDNQVEASSLLNSFLLRKVSNLGASPLGEPLTTKGKVMLNTGCCMIHVLGVSILNLIKIVMLLIRTLMSESNL